MTELCENGIIVLKGGGIVSISQDKTRTNITIPKDLKEKLEQIAKEENRSFNNLLITVLQEYVKLRKI